MISSAISSKIRGSPQVELGLTDNVFLACLYPTISYCQAHTDLIKSRVIERGCIGVNTVCLVIY